MRANYGFWLLRLSAAALLAAGLFAIGLGVTGRFLPHDERFLGLTARDLCARHGCRVVHFMIHDRVSFGGALAAIGILYFWMIEEVRAGRAWAWWTLAVSGATGFASFFAYLGYGYLDTWHGLATLGLLPCFAAGLAASFPGREPIRFADWGPWASGVGLGRGCLLATGVGLGGGGLTILTVGMTTVFVPQDVAYLGVDAIDLNDLNPRLVPLIAHDRAGFGGAVCVLGMLVLAGAAFARPTPGLWRALATAGTVGFGMAIAVHPVIGYTDPVHLTPAVLGALMLAGGLALTCRTAFARARVHPPASAGGSNPPTSVAQRYFGRADRSCHPYRNPARPPDVPHAAPHPHCIPDRAATPRRRARRSLVRHPG
jgi:hypothetical protein